MSHILRRLCTTIATNRSFIPTSFVHQRIRNISISSDNEDPETKTDNQNVETSRNPNSWSSQARGYQKQQSWSQQPGSYEQQFFTTYTFAPIAEVVGPCVVDLYLKEGSYGDPDDTSGGSGFFINEHTILTCAHVVINAAWLNDDSYAMSIKQVEVTLRNGDKLHGVVSYSCMKSDLALITINLKDVEKSFYSVAKLGISHQVRQGDLVCALGSNTLTTGVISNVNRKDSDLSDLGMKAMGRQFIQTDCAVIKASYGGPLVNMRGEVIGVVAMVRTKDYFDTRTDGIAFVTPIDTVIESGMLEGNSSEDGLGGSVEKEEAVSIVTPSNGSESVASQMEALDVCGVASNPETALADLGKRIRALRKKIDFAETQQQETGPRNLKPDEELSKWRQELKVLVDEEAVLVAQSSWDV